MTWTEATAAAITLISVYLSARQNIWSWPTAIVGVGIYVVVFWHSKLYADMGLQFVYIALSIYGWYEWLHGGKNHDELHVSRTPLRGWILTITLGIAASAAAGWAMQRYTDNSMPYSDAATTAFSVAAEAMTTKKWIENWIVWIAVDGVTTWMLLAQKRYVSAALYASFLGLAVIGWIEWKKSLVRSASA